MAITSTIQIDAATAAIIGGAVGAAVSGIFTLVSQWLSRRSETKRHMLDLCFKAATENLHRDLETAKALSQSSGQRVPIGPIDLYLIHMLSLIKISEKSHLSQEEMLNEWVGVTNRTRSAFDAAVEKSKNQTPTHGQGNS